MIFHLLSFLGNIAPADGNFSQKPNTMKYFSTRGHPKKLGFEEAVLQGLAPDGGLYLPEEIPLVQDLEEMVNMSFVEIAFKLYRPYISINEVPDKDLKDLCQQSFATFSHKDVTPVVKLSNVASDPDLKNLWILELFHGPTFAFKDVALQFLGNLFEYFLKRRNAANVGKPQTINVLGATSGDTGGAAIYGLRGKRDVNVFILHPYKRISPVQEAQMASILDANGIKY